MVGGHSLAAASLVARIERCLSLEMPLRVLYPYPTIAGQAAWLLDCPPGAPRNLITLQPKGSLPPLYIVHGLGGTVGTHIELSRTLAPNRPVLALQASEDAKTLPVETAVAQIAIAYANQILAAHRGGPIHLMGYSAGGWYAYAVAAELLQHKAQLGVLAIFDTNATVRFHRRLGLAMLARRLQPRLLSNLQGMLRPPADQSRKRYLIGRLRSLNQHAGAYVRLRLPGPRTLAAWVTRSQGAAPSLAFGDPYVQHLIGGYRPPRLPLVVDLFAPQGRLPPLSRLWRFYSLGGVRCRPLFADHHDFYKPELIPQLAEALEAALHQAEGDAAAIQCTGPG